ncbi:MAG: purine-nucleoside phosphorylase [Bryobacteraceae bacterium]
MLQAARIIQSKSALKPKIGLILGTGLGAFASTLADAVRIPYRELPGLPATTVAGHAGEFVLGKLGAADIAVLSGRFHLYEGYTAREVISGIRLLRELGVERVVLTNVSGGIHPALAKGELALISDHINLQGTNPLIGTNDFRDMTDAYSARLRLLARETAARLNIELFEGVYAGMPGPSYETPAEIRFLKSIGADLVGMSTVLETIAAIHLKMEVLGISCVTNMAASLSAERLSHEDVLETAQRISGTFLTLLHELLPRLAEAR